MSITKTTAADFCNGSLTDDMARLAAADDKGAVVEALVSEALEAQEAIDAAQPDDLSDLDEEDFRAYYEAMAEEA